MRKKIITALAVTAVLASVCSFAACKSSCKTDEPLTDSPLSGSTLADFTQGKADAFFESDGWSNGSVFNVAWSADRVNYANGAMNLSIAENSGGSAETNDEYFGGESRSYQYFGYGDFSVRMKPAKIDGTASTFFTCTGPYDLDEEGNENPHDEIDIEFLGKDTTKVQFNYFVNGEGGHEYMYDLGFDASLEYHEYGYRWTSEYIVWFVDGKPVYKVNASDENPLPSTAGRILMNHWCGTEEAEGWMGEYVGSNGVTADYTTVKTSALPIGEIPEAPEVPDITEVPAEGWTDIDYSGFDGWNNYDVSKTDGLTVSHDEAVDGWACCGMDLARGYSWIKFNVKNNLDVAADLRLDVKGSGEGAVKAVLADGGNVELNVEVWAAMIKLDGAEELEVILQLKDVTVDQMVLFLNSVKSAAEQTGSITITSLQGIPVGDEPEDPDKPTPEPPVTPDPEEPVPVEIPKEGWEAVTDNFDGWEMYDLERFTYENFNAVRIINKGATIERGNCFGMNIKSYSYLTFTLINEGDAIEMRFEVKKENSGDNIYKSAITGAYPTGPVTLINDEYNAAVVNLAARQRLDVVLKIDESVETDQIVVFAGSMSEVTANKCKVIISDVKGIINTDYAQAEEVNVPAEGWTDISTEEFNGNEVYKVINNGNGLTVSHEESVAAWSTAQMDFVKNYEWIKFTVTNNGTETAKLRIDVKKNSDDPKLTGMVEKAYPALYATVNKEQKSLGLTIPAGETVEVVVKLKKEYFDWLVVFFDSFDAGNNAATGSITIKDFKGIVDDSIEHADPDAVDKKALSFKASNNVYQLDKSEQETDSLNVVYNNVNYGSYYYIRSDIEQFAANYNTLTFTVTNNGGQEVQLRIGITKWEKYYDDMRENINVCNYDQSFGSTSYQDGRGGTYTSVGAGQTQTITIKYNKNEGPKQLIIYLDSCKKDGNEQRSGNVNLKDFSFSNT